MLFQHELKRRPALLLQALEKFLIELHAQAQVPALLGLLTAGKVSGDKFTLKHPTIGDIEVTLK